MKRLLAIFVVLLLVLGGLFWWRKNRDANINFYEHLQRNKYEIKNDIFIFPIPKNCRLRINSPTLYNTVVDDFSRYNGIPSLEYIKHLGIYRLLSEGDYNYTNLGRTGSTILGFSVKKNYLIFHFKNFENYFTVIRLPDGYFKDFRSESALDKYLKSLGIPNHELKSPTEWDAIWERDGRLPWFPEHIGR